MKRDMDLVRKLLIRIEEVYEPGAGKISISQVMIEGYDAQTIVEHLVLMHEADLLQNINAKQYVTGSTVVSIGNLTNKGYDTLEQIKNDTIWNKTKDIVIKNGLPMVIEVIKDVAATVISAATEGAVKAIKNG